jgi:hypothetical protein
MVPIPEPMVHDGYNFFLIYVPVDTKCYPCPTPNRVFTRRVLGTHCHLYFRCSISLRVIIVFRNITYVIIILYS